MNVAARTHDSVTPKITGGAGAGHIGVELSSGQSAATEVQVSNPLKILVPRPRGQSVWAYLSNFGGGLLPGDRLDVSASIGEDAVLFLGAQSSTKIFRGGPKGATSNNFSATIGSGATLVYAPEVAQGFADSRYRQRQSIHLTDATASLVYLDWYSAGRVARGERWSFAEYDSRAEIRIADKLVFLDSVRLDGADDQLISLPERMGRVNCLATIVILGSQFEQNAMTLLEEISGAAVAKRADFLIVGSGIPGGAVFRVVGNSVETVARQIFPRLSFVTSLLEDNPFQRKW